MGRYSTNSNVFEEETQALEENKIIDISDQAIEEEFADVHDISFPYEPTMEGAEAINAFMEEEYLDLCQEQGFMELAYFEKNRVEMPFEEAFTGEGGLIDRAIKFFQSIGSKIKVLFDKFLAMIMRFVSTDKAFIKMYGEKIKNSSAKVEFKGYNFDFSENVDKAFSKLSSYIGTSATKSEGIADEIRGKALGKGSLSASDYSSELFKLFRSGAKEKEDVKFSPADIVKEITSASEDKSVALKAYSTIKNAINKFISDAKSLKKSSENADKAKSASDAIDIMKMVLSTLQTYNGALLTALKARNRQNKAIAVKLVSGSKEKENKNESFEFDGNLSFV